LEEVLEQTGVNAQSDMASFQQFLKCYEELQDGLVVNFQLVTDIRTNINCFNVSLQAACNTQVDLKTCLAEKDLERLEEHLRKMGVTAPSHLFDISEAEFDEDFLPELQQLSKRDQKALKKFCTNFDSKFLKKQKKGREEVTALIVLYSFRPLCVFFDALEGGMKKAGQFVIVKKSE